MNDLEYQLRASELLETTKLMQRDFAAMRDLMEKLVTALRLDAEMWRDRYEAERQAHIVDLQHFEREQTP